MTEEDSESMNTADDDDDDFYIKEEIIKGVVPEALLKAVGDPSASISTIKRLLEEAIDIRVKDRSAQNVLHVLFQRSAHPENAAELTKMFLEKRAPVNSLDHNSTAPFAYCIMNINRSLKYHKYRKKEQKREKESKKSKKMSHHDARMADMFTKMGFMGRRHRMRELEMEMEFGEYAFGHIDSGDTEKQIEEDTLYQEQIYESLKLMLEAGAETSHCPAVIPHLVHSGMFGGSCDHLMMQKEQRWYSESFEECLYRSFDPLTRGDHEVNKHNLFVWHLAVWRGDYKFLKLLHDHKCAAMTFMADGRYAFQFLYQYCTKPKDLPANTALFIKIGVPLFSVVSSSMLGLGDLLRHVFMKRSFVKYMNTAYCKDTCSPGPEDHYQKEIRDCIHMLHNADWVTEHYEEIEKNIECFQVPTKEYLGKKTSDYKRRNDTCLTVLYRTLADRMRAGRHCGPRPSPFDLSAKPLVEYTELILGYNVNVRFT